MLHQQEVIEVEFHCNCTLQAALNSSVQGAGLYVGNSSVDSQQSIVITNGILSSNIASGGGGAIYTGWRWFNLAVLY